MGYYNNAVSVIAKAQQLSGSLTSLTERKKKRQIEVDNSSLYTIFILF